MEKKDCKLEILTATFGEEGLKRLAAVISPPVKGVRHLVSCQCPGQERLPLPPELERDDVEVIFTPTKGISKNRNNALNHATAPLCLLSDDDVEHTPDAYATIISTFKDNPDVDIATFMYQGPEGKIEKRYPDHSFSLSHPAKGYYVSSIEIAFRREPVINTRMGFNEKFGVGTEWFCCGEDELWVLDLLNHGLHGQFFPHLISIHRHSGTTGQRLMGDPGVLRAQGAVIKRFHPWTAFPRVLLKAHRTSKATGTGYLDCLRPLLYGWWVATLRPTQLFNL